MLIFPAIDLLDGKCVRLKQGKEKTAKVYHDNPAVIAQQWQDQGAGYIHVVNLDGAFGRAQKNIRAIEQIVNTVNIPIQLGGGIRSVDDARQWLDVGVSRVIFGTVAITEPEVIRNAVKLFGSDKVVVGIDAREDKVAIHGWETQTEKTTFQLALEMKEMGVRHLVYTDIKRDGELIGPNIDNTVALAEETQLNVIASGGFSRIEDLRALANARCEYIEGAIIGTALYENQLSLPELVKEFG